MNIIQLSNLPNYKINNSFNKRPNKLERMPNCDVVSFSSSRPRSGKLKPNVQNAVNFSDEVMTLVLNGDTSIKGIESVAAKYINDITVCPMSELNKIIPDAQNYSAFFFSKLGQDFKPSANEIYVTVPKPDCDKTELMLFAMNAAHEFTHAEQVQSLDTFNQLKALSKGDYDYANALMGIGDNIFSYFDTIMQSTVVKPVIENKVDLIKLRKYGLIVPQKANVNRQMLPFSLGLRTEQELKVQLRRFFDMYFSKVMKYIEQNQPEVMDMLPDNESYESIKKKLKAYCALKAEGEKEAYTTESEVAKKVMGIDSTLNIDAFTMYYDVLAKAFG